MSETREELEANIAAEIAQVRALEVEPAMTVPASQSSPAAAQEQIYLKHPFTSDVQVLPLGSASLVPLMSKGYRQFHPASPVKGA